MHLIKIILISLLISYFLMTLLIKLSNSSSALRNVFRNEELNKKKNKSYVYNEQTKAKFLFLPIKLFKVNKVP